jgi:hypothetical protein
MNKPVALVVAAFLAPLALVGCQSSSPSIVTYSLNYATGAVQNQVAASGSSATLNVTASAAAGGSAAGLTLTATLNNGYCTLPSSTATTDANGNASFSVTAGSGGGLSCAVTVSLPSVSAARAALGFNLSIRDLQRALTAPSSTLTVPTTPNPTTLDLSTVNALMSLSSPNAALGSANDSFNLRVSGLPPVPAGYTYVLWATNAASVTTGLEAFKNAANTSVSVSYNAAPPANSASIPTPPTDNKANFTRVFVTVESGSAIPAMPSALVALDTGSSVFVQGLQ